MPTMAAEPRPDYHKKPQTNVRLTDEAYAMLQALSDHYGLSASGVIELLVREKARAERVKVNPLKHGRR